ncbi:LysR substrate-binding domain-containing protein [Aliiroseovarius sp. KMU-50]|uniref:LysR substrate-binding domain-containing protein n=1 Tax=Aliiroseovarius salicola TaxID=3009082 RepID=A0ABT4W3R3_9RHOB|nr:LysR substrate-binding domain-containing protein [Aliiroseovarius sp. KMU-50]MDA5095139.1 LysR substrate-binding domain-containing protein [Aliiroseovarius sp. KMU-50]
MLKSELRSFHAVAKHAGFSAASKVLNVSQPTLSTQVKALEQRYGVELFARVGRKVRLTTAGKELFEITSRLSQAETDAENLLDSFRGFHRGQLNIAAVGPFHATNMIIAFKSRNPSIEVGVRFGNSQRCFERILSLEADVGIIAEVPTDTRVEVKPYSQHNVVVFVNSDHPFFNRESISIYELENQPVVRREPGSTTRSAIEEEMDRRGIRISPILELGSREAIWKTVEQGMGIGFVADFEFVPHANLRAIPINDAQVQTGYFLAYLKERKNSRLISSFTDIAIGTVSNCLTSAPMGPNGAIY